VPGRLAALVCATLLGAILIGFLAVSRAEFLNYDDNTYVVNNPHVASGLSGGESEVGHYHVPQGNWMRSPGFSTAHRSALRDGIPGATNIVNLALHARNTLLCCFFALTALTGAFWRSAAVTALFALHRVHVESVAWVPSARTPPRRFSFSSLLAYRSYVDRPGRLRYLSVCLLPVSAWSPSRCSYLSFLLLLLDFWPLGRVTRFGTAASVDRRAPVRRSSLSSFSPARLPFSPSSLQESRRAAVGPDTLS